MSTARPDDKASDIPEILYDSQTKTQYERLRFFGKVIKSIYPIYCLFNGHCSVIRNISFKIFLN
jgi:hypothetical protein